MMVADVGQNILSDLPVLVEAVRSKSAFVHDKISFRQLDASGVGIFADSSLLEGEVLISIPFQCCISPESVQSHPKLHQIFEDNPGLANYPDEVLAIGLMYSRMLTAEGGSSHCDWWSHVQVMPASFNTPLYWTESELGELKTSNVFHLTKLMKNQIANDWNQIHGPLIENYPSILGGSTLETYTWALSVIYSRAVGIQRNGKYVRCIPPVIDMANHNPIPGKLPENTFAFDENADVVQLINCVDRQPGDEINAIYGTYTNAKLLYNYGFVVLDSPDRAIDVWARVPPTATAAQRKQDILNSHPLTRNQTYDFEGTVRENFVSPALLATIRTIQLTEGEFEKAENAFRGQIVSVRNELATYSALRSLFVAKMHVDHAEVSHNDEL